MKNETNIKKEAVLILNKLLEINNQKIKVQKYLHQIVLEIVENKKNYLDVLYEVVRIIPLDLYVTDEPYFKFDTTEELLTKHRKYHQYTIYDQ